MGLVILWGFSLQPVSNGLLSTLEGQPARLPTDVLDKADAVVVPSGIQREVAGAPLNEWNEGVDRFEAGVELWLAGKAPYLVFTGGWVPWRPDARPEGEILAIRAKRHGVEDDAILVTGKVGNTVAEAAAVFDLLQSTLHNDGRLTDQVARVILVTSAFHMPRASRIFEQAGLQVQKYPVAFLRETGRKLTPIDFLPSPEALSNSQRALREWLGIMFYRTTGKL